MTFWILSFHIAWHDAKNVQNSILYFYVPQLAWSLGSSLWKVVRLFLCVNGRCIFISCCLIPFNDPTEICCYVWWKSNKKRKKWKEIFWWVLMRDIRIDVARDMSVFFWIFKILNWGFFDGFWMSHKIWLLLLVRAIEC